MRILVIGDSCTDIFVYGDCSRLNPEAPTPVFVPEYETDGPGMAANVYRNIDSVRIHEVNIWTNTKDCRKIRFVDKKSNYILLRVDSNEAIDRIELDDYDFSEWDVVVISDYNKGFLSESDIQYIAESAKLTFLDTKKPLGDWANRIDWIKINLNEFNNPSHDKDFIKNKYNQIVVTMGGDGTKLGDENYPTEVVEVRDVVGAGDTFLAALVLKYLETNDIEESIKTANICATESVKHKGLADLSGMKKHFKNEK